jgi:hypothetical protein
MDNSVCPHLLMEQKVLFSASIDGLHFELKVYYSVTVSGLKTVDVQDAPVGFIYRAQPK